MLTLNKPAPINLINTIINIFILLIPIEVIISGLSQEYNHGYKLVIIYGILSIVLTLLMFGKINWGIAYKINKLIIIGSVLVTVIAIVSSLVLNTTTSNLFLEGFNFEVIPLILLVTVYIYSQQNQFIINKTTKIILLINILLTNVLFLLSNLHNLPPKINQLLIINPNYYGLLNLLLLGILTNIHAKSDGKYKYLIKVIAALIIFLQLIFSPLVALFSIAGLILLILKNKYQNLDLTKYIILTAFTIALSIGFLTNLSGLNYTDFVNTIRRDVTIISNAKIHNLYGYGLGNASKVGEYKYGSNYDKFLNRPLIKDNQDYKQIIPNVELGIIQLIISGGVLFAFIYFAILLNIAFKQARSSYYFFPILTIILTLLFFNPLSFLPLFYTLALASLLVL